MKSPNPVNDFPVIEDLEDTQDYGIARCHSQEIYDVELFLR